MTVKSQEDRDEDLKTAIVRELDLTLDLAHSSTFEVAMHAIADQIRLLIGAHQSAVSYVPDGDFKQAIHTTSFSEKYKKYNNYDVMPTGEGIWALIVENREPVRMTEEQVLAHPRFNHFGDMKDDRGLEHPPMVGWLAVPVLRQNGEFIGVLQLTDKFQGPFTEDDMTNLLRFSHVAGLMLELHFMNSDLLITTERVKKAERELQEHLDQHIRQERLAVLGQLAGGVGHELRNPLGVISNAVFYLKTVLPDPDETVQEYLGILSSEVHRAEKIVSDLLDISRTKPLERKDIEPTELVTQVLERQLAPEQVKVVKEWPPDVQSIYVDPIQIQQVLDNLITNAYQAMPEGGTLTLKVWEKQDQVHLSITDTGSGIPQENIHKLFEPLFTTKARGIGLGLTVSETLAEANGGSIAVQSKDGQGSTFTVSLPVEEQKS